MSEKIRIIITGDIHPGGGRVRELAEKNDAEQLFGKFLPLIRGADLSITNLESPAIDEGEPIAKTGPNLKSPVATVRVLKSAGIGLVTLANNHIMDYDYEGLCSTLDACEEAGIETTGAGNSLEQARKPFIRDIRGIRISVINIAENEFGTTQNGTPGCQPLDPVQNYYTIQQAKREADRVIVIVHGGHEHYELPSPRMKETYRFFANAGADAVVGHHTHCISGHERYNGVPILYSLGNFLFDKHYTGSVTPWHVGMMAELEITEEGVKCHLHPFVQNAEKAGLRELTPEEREEFDTKISGLNRIIGEDELLGIKFEEYCTNSRRLYSSYIEPHSIRILHALRNRNLAPSLLTERKKRLLLNLTRCEAHRDVLIKTLRS
jgi:hypothetical protein